MALRAVGLCLSSFALYGCASVLPLSGPVTKVEHLPEEGLRIGLVADSQLQTRSNYNRVFGYSGEFEDFIVKTSVRPPALDWAARSMLRSDLERLHRQKSHAIFYLGDGANNGCYDEFALGFQDGAKPGQNEQGVLALLDEFRTRTRVPVFFIIGNHDILGAGSTARTAQRNAFCEGSSSSNRSILKLEAMKLVDAFNRGNAAFAGTWRYRSNWDEATVGRACGSDPQVQHRTSGCYLAAAVDYARGDDTAQILLLDTNDWADVTDSNFVGLQQEGIRGAMSFVDVPDKQVVSQTTWFDRNASGYVKLRVALSHYDLAGLTKNLPLIGPVSHKTQLYMNLFTDGAQTRTPIQDEAYVATGHTHVREIKSKSFTFKMDCGRFRCAKTNRFGITELNVGSTTDYSNYATIARFEFGKGLAGGLSYSRVEGEPDGCADIWDAISVQPFPRKLLGLYDRGWKAIGIDRAKRTNYHKFGPSDVQDLWANLDAYAGNDAHRANCIGRYAAAVEAGVDPLKRQSPQR